MSFWDFLLKAGSETPACQMWNCPLREVAGVMNQVNISFLFGSISNSFLALIASCCLKVRINHCGCKKMFFF